jgi:hypothetical protein
MLNYFGKDGQLAKDLATKFGVNITLHGPKSPEIVIENQKKSNILLILNSQIFPHAMSSKLFEYVSLGKKSLLVSPKGDLSLMAPNFPSHTFHAEEHEVDRISIFIHEQYAMFVKTGQLFFEEPPALLEKYSFNTLTGQLLQWLNK